MMVRSFSIQQKRNVVEIRLFCFTPRGKEKIVKVYFSLPTLEEFISKVKNDLEKLRGGLKEELSYLG